MNQHLNHLGQKCCLLFWYWVWMNSVHTTGFCPKKYLFVLGLGEPIYSWCITIIGNLKPISPPHNQHQIESGFFQRRCEASVFHWLTKEGRHILLHNIAFICHIFLLNGQYARDKLSVRRLGKNVLSNQQSKTFKLQWYKNLDTYLL